MQFPGKLINQTWKNDQKKLILEPILDHLAQICPPPQKIFFEGFTFSRYYTLLQAIIVCNFKEN